MFWIITVLLDQRVSVAPVHNAMLAGDHHHLVSLIALRLPYAIGDDRDALVPPEPMGCLEMVQQPGKRRRYSAFGHVCFLAKSGRIQRAPLLPFLTHSRHWSASKAAGMRHGTAYGMPAFLLRLATSSGTSSNGLAVSWRRVCGTSHRKAHS